MVSEPRQWCLPFLLCLLVSCVVNPQPQPGMRVVDIERLGVSAPSQDGTAIVSGRPGAAAGPGVVVIRDVQTDAEVAATTSTQGAFSAQIDAGTGDRFALRFQDLDLRESEEVFVTVAGTEAPLASPTPAAPLLPPPNAHGMVLIEGLTGATEPDVRVYASNMDRPAVGSVASSPDGSFALDLFAASGEQVALFSVDENNPNRASAAVTLLVDEASEEDCQNGADDDGDRLTDCDDPDCADFCRCPGTETFCGGLCVDTDSDPLHCGRCDRGCPATEPNCVRGECYR